MSIISDMKKFIVTVLILIFVFTFFSCKGENEDFIRIHIRANSDGESDQEIKLVVRDVVVTFLTPLLKDAISVQEAEKIIRENVDVLDNKIELMLNKCGYEYGANIKIDREYFDDKSYGELTLKAGVYKAVIVSLGKGVGKNWWCVAYPPLCFSGEDYNKIKYKSYFYEIFSKKE